MPVEIPAPASTSRMAAVRVAALLAAAVLCSALADQTSLAMSGSEPWWLGHAASLTIRAFGADLVKRTEAMGEYRVILHLGVIALG